MAWRVGGLRLQRQEYVPRGGIEHFIPGSRTPRMS
ncbi:hypothetical protein Micau_1749 [Micromonospora aurantiaca ATCC 27029]|nr:hypothetical protein Micau_1749 [Micromonospora aurantiaca ATCC 27029]